MILFHTTARLKRHIPSSAAAYLGRKRAAAQPAHTRVLIDPLVARWDDLNLQVWSTSNRK